LTFDGTNLVLGAANPLFQGSSSTGSAALSNNSAGAFVRVYGGSHATRANFTDFINASSTSTFDSAGNLGLGVTPSTNWTSSGSQKALQLGAYAALSGSGVGGSYYQTVLGMNCVDHTTGTKYLNNGYATAYIQDTGRHYWNIAGVGTAGNAVSFTSAMFLTEAGRLGIATTTPTSLLSVGTLGTTAAPGIQIGSATNGSGSLYFGDGTG
jgi:hypothetical protein